MASALLNEFQAAAFIGMSPTLLRYLAQHQVKRRDKRRLTIAKEVRGTLHFEKAELMAYDVWLRGPLASERQ